MPFTGQLDLDAEAEATLGALSETLAGIPGLATVRKLGDAHHISLANYDDPPLEQFVPALAAFAEDAHPARGTSGEHRTVRRHHERGVPGRGRDRGVAGVAPARARGARRVPGGLLGALSPWSLVSACQPCVECNKCRGPGRDRHAARAKGPINGQDRGPPADQIRPGSLRVSARADLALSAPRGGLDLADCRRRNAAVTAPPSCCGPCATV